MPRFFLNLNECGTSITDGEGSDFADLPAAYAHATKSARELMCAEIKEGRLCLSCCIVIEDEAQQEVGRLPFRDAVVLTGL